MNVNPLLIHSAMDTLVKNMHDFVFVKDADLRYIAATESFAKNCIGLNSVEELIGKTDFEIIADQQLAQKYRDDDLRLIESKQSLHEYREEYPSLNGRQRYCLTSKDILLGPDGNILGLMGMCRDITEQVEAERANEDQLAILNEQANIFTALRNAYNLILYFDFERDYFRHIAGIEHADDIIPFEGKLSYVVPAWLEHDLTPETREAVRDFFDYTTLAERLTKNGILTRELESMKFGWMRVSLIPVTYDENEAVTSCLWVSTFIGDEVAMRATLENRISILNALRNIYRVCLFWDLNSNSYFTVAGTTFKEKDIVPDNGALDVSVNNWLTHDLSNNTRAECGDMFDLATLPERLRETPVLTRELYTIEAGWLRTSLIAVNYNPDGTAATCLWVGEDINDQIQREFEHRKNLFDAQRAAEIDALTGLLNRGAGESRIRSQVSEQVPGLLCIIDVNGFKAVNDQLGHSVGDTALKQVASNIQKAFRQQDIVTRFGGDEFMIFAANIETINSAKHCLGRLLESVEDKTPGIGGDYISVSVGSVLLTEKSIIDFDTAYRICDAAMYSCKKDGALAYKLLSAEGEVLATANHF